MKQLKVYPLPNMFKILIFCKNNAILALRYQRVSLWLTIKWPRQKLTVNRQMSKPILAAKCLRYP